jgi:autotransporter-associated beta strand protein
MKIRLNSFLGTFAVIAITQTAHAASVTWNVAGNGTWDTTTGNWSGGSPTANLYVNGDTANFTNTAGGIITLSGTIAPAATNVSAASGTYTFTGEAITNGTLTKSGAGTLKLNASNSYAGGTTLNAGKLDINHATALGGGLLTINNADSTFDNSSGGLITITNNINSTHNTIFAGTNALTTSGTYTYNNSNRVLQVNGSGALTLGSITSSGSEKLRKRGSGTLAITGAWTSGQGIEFDSNAGTVLIGNKASLGTGNLVVINGGSGTLQASTTLTGANKIDNGVTLTGSGELTLSGSNDFEIGGAITSSNNTSKLSKNGINTVTFSGANSYSGGTTIRGGTLALSGSGTLGATTGALAFSGTGTTLNIGSTTQTVASIAAGDTATNISASITGVGGTLNVSGSVVSQGNSGNNGSYSTNPTLGINTGMVVTGSTLIGRSNLAISGGTYSTSRFTSNGVGSADWGRLVISGSAQVTATNGVDGTYGTTGINGTGATFQLELNGGTLSTPLIKVANRDLNAAGPDGSNNDANLIWNGGVVKATGADNANFVQVYGDGGNTGPKQATYVSSGGAKIDTNGLNIGIQVKLLANPSSAGGGLTLNDTAATKGTLTLSGDSTYTGATLVSAGTLLVNGQLGNTAVTVDGSATVGGTGSLGGSLAFSGTSNLRVVNFNDPLAVAGTVTFGSGFGIDNLLGINWDSLDLDTAYTVLTTTQSFGTGDIANFGYDNRVTVGSLGREAYFQNGSLQVIVIPEPSAALLGGLGMLALLRRRRA